MLALLDVELSVILADSFTMLADIHRRRAIVSVECPTSHQATFDHAPISLSAGWPESRMERGRMWTPGLGERVHLEGTKGTFFVCRLDSEHETVDLISSTSSRAENEIPFSRIIPPSDVPRKPSRLPLPQGARGQ